MATRTRAHAHAPGRELSFAFVCPLSFAFTCYVLLRKRLYTTYNKHYAHRSRLTSKPGVCPAVVQQLSRYCPAFTLVMSILKWLTTTAYNAPFKVFRAYTINDPLKSP